MTRRFLIWFWSGGGGGSQFAVRLARRLSLRFGAEAVALSLRADDPTAAWARDLGLNVLSADIRSDRRRPWATLSGLAQSGRTLAAHAADADAVILPMNFAAAAPLSLGLKKPLVYCAHDPAPHPGDYAATMQRVTQAVLLRRAAHVVAHSRYAAEQLAAQGVRARVAPLQSVFEPSAGQAATGKVRLLLAGRMIRYKGLDILADALATLRTRADWRLRIVGEGPALDAAMLARLQGYEGVEARRAWLSDAEMETLIAESDVMLAPYQSATQSGAVAQALALGKPCVATPVGALAEQIGEAGWIAEAANAAAFAAAFQAMLDDPAARAAKAAAAHARATAEWNADHWGWLETL